MEGDMVDAIDARWHIASIHWFEQARTNTIRDWRPDQFSSAVN